MLLNLETLTEIAENTDGTFTYTDEDGVDTIIDISNLETLTLLAQAAGNTDAEVTAGDANTIATYTDEDGSAFTINETVTALVENTNGTVTYTDEAGNDTIIDVTNLRNAYRDC
ncbi:hypothetical protein BST93_00450 [Nonlabens tegetincola]|nr:hypothetical protein BST93_00450 [Nonlabens tegetincola]